MVRVKSFLSSVLCLLGGHRPESLESEVRRRDAPTIWVFRCGDCGKKFWWPGKAP